MKLDKSNYVRGKIIISLSAKEHLVSAIVLDFNGYNAVVIEPHTGAIRSISIRDVEDWKNRLRSGQFRG